MTVTQFFDHDPASVWGVITLHEHLVKWYFEQLPGFEAKKGFQTSFAVRSEERTFTHIWEVTEVVPEKRISYSWSYKEYSGNSLLTMNLDRQDAGTLLTLTHRTLEDFPDGIPEFKRESCLGGWRYFINDRLKNYLK